MTVTTTPNIRIRKDDSDVLTDVLCPYCGHRFSQFLDANALRPQVVLCEVETGGCDEFFVATVSLTATVNAYGIAEHGEQ